MSTHRAILLLASSIQKPGESRQDCQDAFSTDLPTGRFAVADGAGNSFFPAIWADLLAQRFCNAALSDLEALVSRQRWQPWLKPIRERWLREVERTIDRIGEDQRFLFQNRLKQGDSAGAAFVGLWLLPDQARWVAVTVGDSCLFHIRGQRLLRSFPMQHADQFSSRTEAIMSVAGADEVQGQVIIDELRPGDTFLLASDALSKWLLTQRARGAQAWSEAVERLLQVRSSTDLNEFVVEQQRADRPVDHDDVTVVAVSIGESAVHASVPSQAEPRSWFDATPEPSAPVVGSAAAEPPLAPPPGAPLPAQSQRQMSPSRPSGGWLPGIVRRGWRLPGVVRRLDQSRAVLLAILAVSLLNLGVSCRGDSSQAGQAQRPDSTESATDFQNADPAATAPVPVRDFPVLLLPSAQSLYITPGARPVQFLTLERPAEIPYDSGSDARWRRVETVLWVAPPDSGVAAPTAQGDSLVLKGPLDVWTDPRWVGDESQRAGVIDVQRMFRYDNTGEIGGRSWYRLRIPTWIRDDRQTEDGS